MAVLQVAKHDGQLLVRVPLDERRRLTIGRSPRCHLRLQSGAVSRRHALLFRHGRKWHVVDTASRTGLYCELERVAHAILDPTRWIRLGPAYLWLQQSPRSGPRADVARPHELSGQSLAPCGLPDADAAASGPRLAVLDAAGSAIQRFALGGRNLVTIGRDPACDVILADGEADRLHCVLYTEHRGWYVTDVGSTNGTRIDGRPTRRRRLEEDLLVRVGASVLWLEAGSAPENGLSDAGMSFTGAIDADSAFFDAPDDVLNAAPVAPRATV